MLVKVDETWLGRMQLTIVMSGETKSFSASKGINFGRIPVGQLSRMNRLF